MKELLPSLCQFPEFNLGKRDDVAGISAVQIEEQFSRGELCLQL